MMDRTNRSAGRWLVLLLGSVVASIVLVPALSRVQAQFGHGDGGAEQMSNVFLPAPRGLRQSLSRAQTAVDEQRFSDAVAELGAILTGFNVVNPAADLESLGQDYFIGPGQDPRTQTSIKAEAQRLLGSMPAKGRELYELQFGADARGLLEESLAEGDPQKLAEVTRKFFHTSAGYEATMLLGRYQLDQGRSLAAALCFQRIVSSAAAAERFEPEASLLLATCWLHAQMPAKAEQALADLQRRMPQAAVRIGDQQVSLFDRTGNSLARLEQWMGRPSDEDAAAAAQWTMYRGDASRNARSRGSLPLVNFRWRVPTANDPGDEREIAKLQRDYLDQQVPALPAMQPLAVDDVVLMRTPQRLVAVDFASGKRIWEFPWFDASQPQRMQDGQTQERQSGTSIRELQLNQRLWMDAPFGQLSSDGRHVFFLDDLGYAGQGSGAVTIVPGGFPRQNQGYAKLHNKLVAVDLKTEGKLRWMVGGESGEDEPKLAGAFFLGPPLPLLGQLYVLMEMNGEVRLAVLDAATGSLAWSQQLGHVDTHTILRDSSRRLAGATPSFADGVLICPTSAGAIVALDITTRTLLWGYQYEQLQPARRRFGIQQTYSQQPQQPGQRWADASVTIVDGKVLITPVESDELYCLDLLSGQEVWPSKKRRDLLYVACVHRDQVVLVGRSSVEAYRLDDGEPAWSKQIQLDGAMPSGRGFYSDDSYYLPTTGEELLRLDLIGGKIAARVGTGQILGNLICYRDEVLSHNVDSLATFYQIAPLRERVEQRLAENNVDPWALARKGELLLHDGRRREALAVLRQAHQLNQDDDGTRALLVDTLLRALGDDFAANRQMAQEVEQLIDQPDQRTEYLRLMAMGYQKLGNAQQAFETFLKLAERSRRGEGGVDSTGPALESVAGNWEVRRDRWLQGRIAALLADADAEQRAEMDEVVATRLQAAMNAGSQQALRRFINLFGSHPSADEARLQLAAKMIDSFDMLEAELLLARLQQSQDRSIAAAATAHTAELLERARKFEQAADYYRQLNEHFADVVCVDDKTGRQLFEQALASDDLKSWLAESKPWPLGHVQVSSGPDKLNRPSVYQRVYPVELESLRGAVPEGMVVAFDQRRSGGLIFRDGRGEVWLDLPLYHPDGRRISNPTVSHGQANGHLFLIAIDGEMIAIDALQGGQNATDAVLWRKDLIQSLPGAGRNVQPVHVASVRNPWGEQRQVAADKDRHPIGVMAPISDEGVCFQKNRELLCVDPLSGETIWRRTDIEPGCELFGDDQHLLVVPPGSQQATVYSPIDGEVLGQRPVAVDSQRWTIHGRRVLSWTQAADRLTLSLDDVWTGEQLWSLEVSNSAKGQLIGTDEVAVLTAEGELTIVELASGHVRVQANLEPEPSLRSLIVHRTNDQYLVAANQGSHDSSLQPAPDASYSSLIRGKLYAFARETGQPQWQVPAAIENYSLPLDQPIHGPVLALLRQTRSSQSRRSGKTSVLCLDRRDGRVLLHEENLPVQAYAYEMHVNRAAQSVELLLPNKTLTLQFTEQPVPPEPSAQLGDASSLKTGGGVSSLAGALFNAFIPTEQTETDHDVTPERDLPE